MTTTGERNEEQDNALKRSCPDGKANVLDGMQEVGGEVGAGA
jgi:hypothetical protein